MPAAAAAAAVGRLEMPTGLSQSKGPRSKLSPTCAYIQRDVPAVMHVVNSLPIARRCDAIKLRRHSTTQNRTDRSIDVASTANILNVAASRGKMTRLRREYDKSSIGVVSRRASERAQSMTHNEPPMHDDEKQGIQRTCCMDVFLSFVARLMLYRAFCTYIRPYDATALYILSPLLRPSVGLAMSTILK